jgi:hypothetical protein
VPGRRKVGNSPGQPEDVFNSFKREQAALSLWLKNYSYSEIAQVAGFDTKGGALRAVKRALARIPQPQADHARAKITARCDWLQRELLEARMTPEVVNAAIAIDKFRASLLGLNLEPPSANVQATQVVIQELPREMIEGV